jgi:hypothetical protein
MEKGKEAIMPKPFDATLKDLVTQYPADWLALAGFSTTGPVEVLDADLSAVTAASDKVLLIREEPPWLLHLEMESSYKAEMSEHLFWHHALLAHRQKMLVRSIVLLLRPAADSPRWTGEYLQGFPNESPHLRFSYRVLRVWELATAQVLAGGLGTLPLAPLTVRDRAALPSVVRALDNRLTQDATPKQAEILGSAAIILNGLWLPKADVLSLYQGARFMSILKDSSAYELFRDWALEKATAQVTAQVTEQVTAQVRLEEARRLLLRLGQKHLGPLPPESRTIIEGITSVERLEELNERLFDVDSWQSLLAGEASNP